MQLGMIGLGRMGANIVRRLMRDGHECVVYDVSADVVDGAGGRGRDRRVLAGGLRRQAQRAPRRVDHGARRLRRADRERARRATSRRTTSSSTAATATTATTSSAPRSSAPQGIHYVDVGTSGGVFGLERGFCMMIGGEDEPVKRLDPIFRTIAPGIEAAERTPGRSGDPVQPEYGYLHCGPPGAGHFVKMVHNGIEYGIMAAYAEGIGILRNANVGLPSRSTTPRRPPCAIRSSTSTRSTRPRWPRSGGAAASSRRGCSTSRRSPSTRTRTWTPSAAASRTPARAAGRSSPRWTRASPPTS